MPIGSLFKRVESVWDTYAAHFATHPRKYAAAGFMFIFLPQWAPAIGASAVWIWSFRPAWLSMSMPDLSWNWITVPLGLLFMALVWWETRRHSTSNALGPEQTPAAPAVQAPQHDSTQRFFTPRTASELIHLVRIKTTGVRRRSLLEPHVGKWLYVDGEILDIRYAGDKSSPLVIVGVPNPEGVIQRRPHVALQFDATLASVLFALDKSDRIRANGRIDSVTPLSIWVKDCELIGYDGRAAQTRRDNSD